MDSFKYLGITLDIKLNFSLHQALPAEEPHHPQAQSIVHQTRASYAPQHHCIHSLVLCRLLFTFLPLNNKNKLLRITHTCSKIIGSPTPSLPDLIINAIIRQSLHMLQDHRQPLHPYLTLLHSVQRFKIASIGTSQFSKSFVPTAITALNSRQVDVFLFLCVVCYCWRCGEQRCEKNSPRNKKV